MKIGVLTYWTSYDNYGQLLQCWALQQYLIENGHDPYLICYKAESGSNIKCFLRRVYHFIRFCCNYIYSKNFREKYKNKNNRCFDTFRSKYLIKSKYRYKNIFELRTNPPDADCYITGSDQVWARSFNSVEDGVYFLNFGPSSTKRISYAPSFSMSSFPSEHIETLKQYLSLFDIISVREKSGIEFCEKAGFISTLVCDPTLLLKKESYQKILRGKKISESYIYIYSINIKSSDEIRWHELKMMAQRMQNDIFVTTAGGYIPSEELFDREDVVYDYSTIGEWLANIANANLVVTPSFHGVVFSIIFHVPFVYVPLANSFSSGNNRVFDLLEVLNLSDRVLLNDKDYYELYKTDIKWEQVDKMLEEFRVGSVEYLNNALEM